MKITNKILFALLLLAFAAYGQQKRIAIINTVDDGEPPVGHSELNHLTDRLREIALKTLPGKSYAVMTQQSIVAYLGSQEDMVRKCKESEGCLAKLGREINADYVCQARIGRFSEDLTIKAELYEVQKGNLVGSFTGSSKDIYGLLSVLDKETPNMFKKMPGVSGIKTPPVSVANGIRNLERAVDYEFDDEKRYLANISTEPQGAALSFDGVPDDRCSRTPCKTEFPEGDVRIIARLDQYETADTTVSISHNNQNVVIALKSNFGVLEIEPAYSDGIGEDRQWNLAINDMTYSLGKIRLSPGSYAVKLNHECYENISFTAGIHKGKREVFDMPKHIVLKKGGLVLRAERYGDPVSEPVFVNREQVGETPFTGSVPLCAGIEVGKNREKVEADLKYKDKMEYTHKMWEQEEMQKKEEYKYDYNSYKTPNANVSEGKKKSYFGTSILILLAGGGLTYYGYSQDKEMLKRYDEYKAVPKDSRSARDEAWNKAEKTKKSRDKFYTAGGIFLGMGIFGLATSF